MLKFNKITYVGVYPLNMDWMRQNEYEIHQINKSQEYTKFCPM